MDRDGTDCWRAGQGNHARRLFLALLHRYDIKPYRYYRQRYTTVMAKISRGFVDETLWPHRSFCSSRRN